MAQFDRYSAFRVARATRKAEREPRGGPLDRGAPPRVVAPAVYLKVTTQVELATGSTLGKGKGRIQAVSYSSADVATYAEADPTDYWIYSGALASGATIAVGRLVIAIPIGGRFHTIVDFCTS